MARTCIENAIFLITSRQICLKNRNLCTYRRKNNLPASQAGQPSSAYLIANRRLTDIPTHTACRSPIDAAAGQAVFECRIRRCPSRLQRPAERLMQQRLLQFVEGAELALVEGFEGLGFFAQQIKLLHYIFLHIKRRQWNQIRFDIAQVDMRVCCSYCHTSSLLASDRTVKYIKQVCRINIRRRTKYAHSL